MRIQIEAYPQDRPLGPACVDRRGGRRRRPMPPSRRIAMALAWAGGVLLLTPLILIAGVAAVLALPVLAVSRHVPITRVGAPRRASTVRSVLHLEPPEVESSLVTLGAARPELDRGGDLVHA